MSDSITSVGPVGRPSKAAKAPVPFPPSLSASDHRASQSPLAPSLVAGSFGRDFVPNQCCRVEYRAIHAYPAVVPAVRRLDLRHAAEADADAAGHRRLQRQMTWHV